MAPVVIRRSHHDLREERRHVLDAAGMSGKELREAARRDDLTGEQWDGFERLREIDFLVRHGGPQSRRDG